MAKFFLLFLGLRNSKTRNSIGGWIEWCILQAHFTEKFFFDFISSYMNREHFASSISLLSHKKFAQNCPSSNYHINVSCLFVCLFVWIKPGNLYFAPCVWREVITPGNACMLVCGDFICTLEIIARILREVVNRERLCCTNTQASWLPQFLGLSNPLQK